MTSKNEKKQENEDSDHGNNDSELTFESLLVALRRFKKGDFSVRLPEGLQGIEGEVAQSFNEVVDFNQRLAAEFDYVQKAVGKEGKITQRASLEGASQGWRQIIISVNELISDIVQQTTEISRVIGSVAKGDLTQTMLLEVEGRPIKGEFLRTARTINTMVEQLGSFASEVTRVAREVGTEGKLGGEAEVKGVTGVWRDLTDNVNTMARNLTGQVRGIATVVTAVANGDLKQKLKLEARGEIASLADTINGMIETLAIFADQVTNVAREVGTEGKLGGQANVPGAAGIWRDLTDNVNAMANNLTQQVRAIADVTTAVAGGNLAKTITIDVKGEIQDLKNTINTMVEQLSSFASEVTRVSREVGIEGKLGGQANVKGVAGIWKELTDNVNLMASNLTDQVRNIANVATAIAKGDLSKKITVDAKGEILELKSTINGMVEQLTSFSSEVTRVAKEVGTEGELGGEAEVKDVAGVWRDLTNNVNGMALNLTNQVRNIATVATAIAKGDLTKKITVDARGEILDLKNTINTMVDQLGNFADEVTRVARDVGTEGVLGGQADVKGVSGTWKELTDNVNGMAKNLTSQVRNIAEVATAIANGDLSKTITVDARGEIKDLKNTINTMVDQLSNFAAEVTRVARDVGTEGVLGGQAEVKGVSGTWKELTDNVNGMAKNLTSQVRNIAEVTTAVANGDLTKKITIAAKGEIQELKNTINVMVDQLSRFADEVTRVAREVGTEGKLGGQADVRGVGGTWRDLTDSVNQMATNLTNQVRNIAEVATAVAKGDLAKKVTVEVKGEILDLKNTINDMVDQLLSFSDEVTRVAREVGTEGKLGGQAIVGGVSGVWRELTSNVNGMASNLTDQVRGIAEVSRAIANGDLSKKITVEARGEIQELKNTINTMVDLLGNFADEVTRVSREVGTEGKLGGQAEVRNVSGVWKDLRDNVNVMASNLTDQVRNIAEVATAIANGDLSKEITVTVKGEVLELKNTINTMVGQLNRFAEEVTRVAREVGTEGKLGGQAEVKGVAGIWKELTENVNTMASNLTDQVRGIADVVTAVARGHLKKKLLLAAKGEIATLCDTINNMTDTLALFADQVTMVAREVGVEGKLGGQAHVPGAAGIWRELTENVNQLAGNLTTQVRAIADVATAVTKGDLTRAITVETAGEVEDLKNNINEMIRNLRETTRINQEQDWLKTNLTKFTRMLQGQKDLQVVSRMILSELAKVVEAQHGTFFYLDHKESDPSLRLIASYAYKKRKNLSNHFHLGEGLVGQCALEKERILITEVPEDYVKINSGLGEATPSNVVVLPVLFEETVKAVIELATFHMFREIQLSFLEQLTESLGVVLSSIEAGMRTEELLKQSQAMSEELQNQQEELQQTNEELEEKAQLLAEQKEAVEAKNREVERTQKALESKAEQLSLTSKYKSEFLANMSHELRTPLNSLLVLSKQLWDNPQKHLDSKEVEFAKTIYESGADLLSLINEILDLSKIESGSIDLDIGPVSFEDLMTFVDRNFQHLAKKKELELELFLGPNLPTMFHTDAKRLKQVIKNLLSNAFKFTEKGKVSFKIFQALQGWSSDHKMLNEVDTVVGLSVSDTGIGIAKDKHHIIFEAFQQADASTSRRYGGTGLGLSISREISNLLGGEIQLESEEGKGSTFTLYLPLTNRNFHTAKKTIQEVERAVQRIEQEDFSPVQDDRNDIHPGDRTLLIIEGDKDNAAAIRDLAHRLEFKCLIAIETVNGWNMAVKYVPDAILLDIYTQEIEGWILLDRLKHDLRLRHIPVHIFSPQQEQQRGLRMGALSLLEKPASARDLESALYNIQHYLDRKTKRLLIVEDDEMVRKEIVDIIDHPDVETISVATGQQALEVLEQSSLDCMVLDLRLPDVSGLVLLEKIQEKPELRNLPVIIYTAKELDKAEETQLRRFSEAIIIKDVSSIERLLDETALFLHRKLPEKGVEILHKLQKTDPDLAGKKVLIVDDDIRNIFALHSILERQNMKVVYTESGKEALDLLKQETDVDIILMDIMMPEMDGHECIREIREMDQYRDTPIIAVTAKAMQEDREQSIKAGASDYITKPVDTDQLLSLLRVWTFQK